MNREILFRGKSIKTGGWVFGSLITYMDGTCFICTPSDDPDALDKWGVAPETVGQYTGLTDKNGKKIFEGDIVKCKHTVQNAIESEDYSKIRYSYGGKFRKKSSNELMEFFGQCIEYVYWRNYAVEYYKGNLRLHNKSCVNDLSWNYIFGHDIELIGNIHDNPELIGGVGE